MRTAPNTSRQRLCGLLEQEIEASRKLISTLEKEYSAIISRNSEVIQQAVTEKQHGLQHLEAIGRERTTLIESLGFGADTDGMEDCLRWCDPENQARQLWQELLGLAVRCRDSNRANYQLVELGRRHIYQALRIIRGEESGQDLYGPAGDTHRRHKSRSLGTV